MFALLQFWWQQAYLWQFLGNLWYKTLISIGESDACYVRPQATDPLFVLQAHGQGLRVASPEGP